MRRVVILLFDGVELLDFAGPYEVFFTAARISARQFPNRERPFAVCTIAVSRSPVRSHGGLMILPDYVLEEAPPPHVLIVPGGVVDTAQRHTRLISWLKGAATVAEVVSSVCTGAFLLGQAGLLTGRRVTTHWEDIPALRAMLPNSQVEAGARWVDAGDIVTAAGISAGIDMALHLVARLEGRLLAEQTARQMEYDWSADS